MVQAADDNARGQPTVGVRDGAKRAGLPCLWENAITDGVSAFQENGLVAFSTPSKMPEILSERRQSEKVKSLNQLWGGWRTGTERMLVKMHQVEAAERGFCQEFWKQLTSRRRAL